MKEFINVAEANGLLNEKVISDMSDPWIINEKCKCIYESVRDKFTICDLCCIKKVAVSQTGINEFEICGDRIIKVNYGITIKYVDCCCNEKTITRSGNVMFYKPPRFIGEDYTVYITNPPKFNVCCNSVTVKFCVILCDQ